MVEAASDSSLRTRRVVAWRGRPVLEERPMPSVKEGWVLVKVISAAWGPIEEAAARYAPPDDGRIMGTMGYGVIVDLGVGAPKWLAGRRVAWARLPRVTSHPRSRWRKWWILDDVAPPPGLSLDGWLAEYAALPPSSLGEVYFEVPDWLAPITPAAGLAAWVARWFTTNAKGERLAIVGSGPTGLLAAWAARYLYDLRVEVYGYERWPRLADALGVEVTPIHRLRDIHLKLDAVLLTTVDAYSFTLAAESLRRDGDLLLHPIYSWLPLPHRPPRLKVTLIREFPAESGAALLRRAPREAWRELVAVVEGGLAEPPPVNPKPYVVYTLSSS